VKIAKRSRHGLTRLIAAVLLLVVAAVCSRSAAAQANFVLYSQNMLHLGYDGDGVPAQKCAQLQYAHDRADLIVLQELMNDQTTLYNTFNTSSNCKTAYQVGTFVWGLSGPLGKGKYKEYYGFLYRPGPLANHPLVQMQASQQIGKGNGFERPPFAGLFLITPNIGNPKRIVVADYHATYKGGKDTARAQLTARRTEVKGLARFVNPWTVEANWGVAGNYCNNGVCDVIIAGDWNLAGTDTNSKNIATFSVFTGMALAPNVQTSLTEDGGPSEPYDHFVYTQTRTTIGAPTPPNNNPAGYGGLNGTCAVVNATQKNMLEPSPTHMSHQLWRDNISDHLGIVGCVAIQ